MTAGFKANANGTQASLQIGGVDAVVFDAGGISSGYKDASITSGKFNGAQSGTAPIFGARAWCVFNGTLAGTNAPAGGGNIASITKTGTGTYSCLFTAPLPTAIYAVNMCSSNNGAVRGTFEYSGRTTTGFNFTTTSAGSNTTTDFADVSLIVIG